MEAGGLGKRLRLYLGGGPKITLGAAPAGLCQHSPMQLAKGIRRHGFRKWYERELLQSHAHLLLTFLSAIGLLAAVEAAMQYRGLLDRLIDALAVLACAGIGLWALRRYLYLLNHAEFVAAQADCPDCGSYGRFALVGEPRDEGPTTVCCKKCSRQWSINS